MYLDDMLLMAQSQVELRNPINLISGFPNQLQSNENQTDRAESNSDGGYLQGNSREAVSLCLGIGRADREDDSSFSSHLPSAPVVSGAKTVEEPSHMEGPVIQRIGEAEPGNSTRTAVVVHQDEPDEWEEYVYPGSRYGYRDRCIHAGMGNSLQGCPNWGPVVSGRAEKSQKLLRAAGSYLCGEGIYKGQTEHSGTSTNGQQNSGVLCKPYGRNPLPSDLWSGDPAVAMVSGDEPVSVSRIPTWCRQPCSRQGVQSNPVISRMATLQA